MGPETAREKISTKGAAGDEAAPPVKSAVIDRCLKISGKNEARGAF